MDSTKDPSESISSVEAPATGTSGSTTHAPGPAVARSMALASAKSAPTSSTDPAPADAAIAVPIAAPASVKAKAPAPEAPVLDVTVDAPARQIRWLDLALAASFAVVAAAATGLKSGSIGRVALTMPVLLFIPGYLLLQAALAGRERPSTFHVLMAVGLSPPLVGVLALLAAIVPGGFTAIPIITIVTVACVALAGIAFLRRSMVKPVAA